MFASEGLVGPQQGSMPTRGNADSGGGVVSLDEPVSLSLDSDDWDGSQDSRRRVNDDGDEDYEITSLTPVFAPLSSMMSGFGSAFSSQVDASTTAVSSAASSAFSMGSSAPARGSSDAAGRRSAKRISGGVKARHEGAVFDHPDLPKPGQRATPRQLALASLLENNGSSSLGLGGIGTVL